MPCPTSPWNLWHLRQAHPRWYPLCLTVNTILRYPHPKRYWPILGSSWSQSWRWGQDPHHRRPRSWLIWSLNLNWLSGNWHLRKFRNCPSHLLKQRNHRNEHCHQEASSMQIDERQPLYRQPPPLPIKEEGDHLQWLSNHFQLNHSTNCNYMNFRLIIWKIS